MGWKQTKGFDTGKAGTQKYLCLKNVRLGYGIASKWEYARQDWDNNVAKHADQNFPAGVAVPVYFSWVGTLDGVKRDWGHVAVRLPDGRIWTDGKYYANVGELSKNYISGGAYLGWGESVNGVRVVEFVPDPPKEDPRDARIRELEAQAKKLNGDIDVLSKRVTDKDSSFAHLSQQYSEATQAKFGLEAERTKLLEEIEGLKKQLAEKPKEVPGKTVVFPVTDYPAGDLFRALLQKAVAWLNKK